MKTDKITRVLMLLILFIFNHECFGEIISLENGNCWVEEQQNPSEFKFAFFQQSNRHALKVNLYSMLEDLSIKNTTSIYLQCSSMDHIIFIQSNQETQVKSYCHLVKSIKGKIQLVGSYPNGNAQTNGICIPIDSHKLFVILSKFENEQGNQQCLQQLQNEQEYYQIKKISTNDVSTVVTLELSANFTGANFAIREIILNDSVCSQVLKTDDISFDPILTLTGENYLLFN